jgi:hypothetical protein
MKWLLSLFNKNTKINESNSEDSHSINMQLYSESEFNGINPYLISILYFPNEIEKEKFVLNFNELMIKCGIDNKTSVNEFNRLIAIQEEKDNCIYYFYRMIVEFTIYSVFVKNGVKTRELSKGQTYYNSYENITKSKSGLFIADFNIENKILHNKNDIEFEETLINDTLKNLNYDNERLDMYRTLVMSFNTIGDKFKFEFYLNKIESEYKNYNMSERMIGEVFREIGELFLSKNDVKNCLKWFELGIEIYPKLGVKRKINELKSL